MKTYLAPSYLMCNFSSLLATCFTSCSPTVLLLSDGAHARARLGVTHKIRTIHAEIRHESSGDVTSYWMEQGLWDGTGYINCSLAYWKFTCQLHFDNTCISSDSFQEVVNICSDN